MFYASYTDEEILAARKSMKRIDKLTFKASYAYGKHKERLTKRIMGRLAKKDLRTLMAMEREAHRDIRSSSTSDVIQIMINQLIDQISDRETLEKLSEFNRKNGYCHLTDKKIYYRMFDLGFRWDPIIAEVKNYEGGVERYRREWGQDN